MNITDLFFWAIIIANVLFSYKGFNDYSFFRKYEFHIGSIQNGERYRMLSSAFLHADMMHLAFNMITFYFFAPWVIAMLGNWLFLLIYFGSLFLGNFLTLALHKNDYNYRAVGASGAVTGIIYSAILFNPDANLYLFFAIPIPAYLFGIGYLLYSIYGMKAQNDNIGHTAHFGGAIGGYLLTLILVPQLLWVHTKMVILLAIPIVILFYMMKTKRL
jgi:membrane associated rhomboid family serine protease